MMTEFEPNVYQTPVNAWIDPKQKRQFRALGIDVMSIYLVLSTLDGDI